MICENLWNWYFKTVFFNDFFYISRLNSRNFGIFEPDEFYLNLHSWVKSALKIIKNDTEIAYELHLRAPPTHFQKFVKNFKTRFSGNRTKILISSEAAYFTDSFLVFWNKKIARRKKLWRFKIPEFNLIYPKFQLVLDILCFVLKLW